jgi:hypothetical protein
MKRCWDHEPDARPAFVEVKAELGGGPATLEKVRIGMTDSTFFICREVEVRIRSE